MFLEESLQVAGPASRIDGDHQAKVEIPDPGIVRTATNRIVVLVPSRIHGSQGPIGAGIGGKQHVCAPILGAGCAPDRLYRLGRLTRKRGLCPCVAIRRKQNVVFANLGQRSCGVCPRVPCAIATDLDAPPAQFRTRWLVYGQTDAGQRSLGAGFDSDRFPNPGFNWHITQAYLWRMRFVLSIPVAAFPVCTYGDQLGIIPIGIVVFEWPRGPAAQEDSDPVRLRNSLDGGGLGILVVNVRPLSPDNGVGEWIGATGGVDPQVEREISV